jgi:hypothetical protein
MKMKFILALICYAITVADNFLYSFHRARIYVVPKNYLP